MDNTATPTESYLAAIVEGSDDAIVSKDLHGIIRSCNPATGRIFGYSPGELIGQSIRILIPPDRQAEEDEILARLRRGQRIDHFETIRLAKDGRPVDISLSVSPVRDRSGTVVGIAKIARDITEQKRLGRELAAQQEWFRVTLDSIGDAVIASDPGGHVTYLNNSAEALTGWKADDAIGSPLVDVFRIVNEDTRRTVENPVTRVLAEGTVVGLANHTILIAADGTERPIDDSGAPIRSRDGRIVGVVLVFRDVTERYRAELERHDAAAERERLLEAERAARAAAERANRVKDEFVAMVSHELRTPLNAILGWTQLITKQDADGALVRRGVDVIARNARVQGQLISDLLDVSRIVSGKLQLDMHEVALPGVVADAIDTVQKEADEKGVVIERRFERAVATIAGDPARLRQIVWNLLANAIKFTARGGVVTVSVRQSGADSEITIADTGVGIRPDFLPHIFDRFRQADQSMTRKFGGLGLGLSIVKHLVEQHGGSIRAESAGEGHGATFTIVLPSSPRADRREARDVDARCVEILPAASLAGIRVFVVEDDPDTREFLERFLRASGAEVSAVSTAAEALAQLPECNADILVSDIGLPDMDGYELMQRIRQLEIQHCGAIPAIALTAYARSEDRTRALRAGYQVHLSKPVEPIELVATIASFAELIEAQRGSR